MVEKVKVVVMISDPGLKLNDAKPNKFADDPEFTIKACFLPNNFAILFSKSFTWGPSIKFK